MDLDCGLADPESQIEVELSGALQGPRSGVFVGHNATRPPRWSFRVIDGVDPTPSDELFTLVEVAP